MLRHCNTNEMIIELQQTARRKIGGLRRKLEGRLSESIAEMGLRCSASPLTHYMESLVYSYGA